MTFDRGRREFCEMALLAAAGSGMGIGKAWARQSRLGEWKLLSTQPYPGKQDDIWFADANTGWYGNGEGRLYRTVDGGGSWLEVWRRPGTFIRALAFLDRQRGFLGNVGTDYYPDVTDHVPLYQTSDGGLTWSPITALGIEKVAGICAIDVLPIDRIFQGDRRRTHIVHAAGRVGGPAIVMRSEDEGASWRVLDLSAHASMILDVKFLSPLVGFVAASAPSNDGSGEALILRTGDGGRTWIPVYRSGRTNENVWKMSWPSPRTGYGTVQSYDESPGNQHRVFVKTVDGGRTWREHSLVDGPKIQEFGIGFLDENRGWVGCRAGGYETHDGGRSWFATSIGRAVNRIRIVRDAGGTRVFAIGIDVHRLDLA